MQTLVTSYHSHAGDNPAHYYYDLNLYAISTDNCQQCVSHSDKLIQPDNAYQIKIL